MGLAYASEVSNWGGNLNAMTTSTFGLYGLYSGGERQLVPEVVQHNQNYLTISD